MNQKHIRATITYSKTWTKVILEESNNPGLNPICSFIKMHDKDDSFNSFYDSILKKYLFRNRIKESSLLPAINKIIHKKARLKKNETTRTCTFKYKDLKEFINNV